MGDGLAAHTGQVGNRVVFERGDDTGVLLCHAAHGVKLRLGNGGLDAGNRLPELELASHDVDAGLDGCALGLKDDIGLASNGIAVLPRQYLIFGGLVQQHAGEKRFAGQMAALL